MELHIEPRVVKKWGEFKKDAPPYSIALDGYVYGPPKFTQKGPYANFNHHEGVERLATRSTCAQIYIGLKQGLMNSYRVDGKPQGHIFVNDPDQDTCLAVWLLQNHERVEGLKSEPLISRIVGVEDHLDATAGAYPIAPTTEVMRQLAWVFEPYTQARLVGRLQQMQESEMRSTIESVCERISKHVLGAGEEVELDTTYEMLGGGKDWKLIKEVGAHARTKLFVEGTTAYVSVRDNDDGTHVYTLGKMSPFIRFPIEHLYAVLNEAENIEPESLDRWGGSNIVGGSPRTAGSKLSPKEIEEVINGFLEKEN